MAVVRATLAIGAVLAAGCAFHHGAAGGPGDGASPRDAPDGPADTPPDAAPPFCDPGDTNLVACYAFEDSVADGSSHHLDPDVTSNTSFENGKVGRALVVASDTEVDVADDAAFDVDAFTIEAWIDPAQLPASGGRAGILDCDLQYGFFLHDAGDVWCTGGTATVKAPAGGVVPGQWTHVACTHDGNTIRVYVAGREVANGVAGALYTGGFTGITLGGNNPPGGGDPLDGGLDQLRLYSSARSAADICADAGQTSCP